MSKLTHITHFDDCGCKSAKYEAEIARLGGALRWISVDESLPDDSSWVLVYADGAVNYTVWHRGVWYDWTEPACSNIPHGCITHWMPLPEPPKELEATK